MIFFVVHDVDGTILKYGTCPIGDLPLKANIAGSTALEVSSVAKGRTHRVVDGVAVLKTALTYTLDTTTIVADGGAVATFSGLPAGTTMTADGESVPEDAGAIPFGTDLAGVYVVTLSHPLYLDTNIEITAT